MKKLVKKVIVISLLPISLIFTGCGTLTANSAVSTRHIKAPDQGSLVYMRHSTKVDPNTLSEVSDLQDLRRAIKGDVEEASGGGGLFGIKTIANLFKPTTKANRTFSEVFITNADGVKLQTLPFITWPFASTVSIRQKYSVPDIISPGLYVVSVCRPLYTPKVTAVLASVTDVSLVPKYTS